MSLVLCLFLEPECSVIDSWARGIVPETSELPGEEDEVATPTTSLDHRDTDSVSHADQEAPTEPVGDTVVGQLDCE